MSSLWTPDGEHRVPRTDTPSPAAPGEEAAVGPFGEGVSEEEVRQLAHELTSVPVEDIIANHCYGFFELAALHLSQQPANLEAARTAIDAMGYVVDGLERRLGQHAAALGEGLTQLRLAFVKISETGNNSNGAVVGDLSPEQP